MVVETLTSFHFYESINFRKHNQEKQRNVCISAQPESWWISLALMAMDQSVQVQSRTSCYLTVTFTPNANFLAMSML